MQSGYCRPEAQEFAPVVKSTLEAVERDLAALGDLKDSAEAWAARRLAEQLDAPANSATSKSMCARALGELMDRLRSLAPEEAVEDGIDQLAARREKRRGAAA